MHCANDHAIKVEIQRIPRKMREIENIYKHKSEFRDAIGF